VSGPPPVFADQSSTPPASSPDEIVASRPEPPRAATCCTDGGGADTRAVAVAPPMEEKETSLMEPETPPGAVPVNPAVGVAPPMEETPPTKLEPGPEAEPKTAVRPTEETSPTKPELKSEMAVCPMGTDVRPTEGAVWASGRGPPVKGSQRRWKRVPASVPTTPCVPEGAHDMPVAS